MEQIKNKLTLHCKDHSYDIIIGSELLGNAGKYVSKVLNGNERVMIVSDENVAAHYLEPIKKAIKEFGYEVYDKVFPAGEKTKNPDNLVALCEYALKCGLTRSSLIIALGGGVIGDLTGFFASVMFRGTKFIQIPTTLLSEVDSSVGGKTAVNLTGGKNMMGTFYQPSLVLIDTDTLRTLPDREIKAGYAEIIKYGILDDREFFDYLYENGHKILNRDEDVIAYAIFRCCKDKADIVGKDEKEKGIRTLLNLGHTFAHAYEGYALRHKGYDINHGEAVALGTVKAVEMSCNLGLCPPDTMEKVKSHYEKLNLLSSLPFDDKQELIDLMYHDKKATKNALNFVLIRGIGRAFLCKNVDEKEVLKVL